MKKVLIVLTLMLTLGMGAQAAAQKHRHTPRGTELVDTTKHNSAVDAFSDTTDTAGVNYFNDEDFDEDEQIKRGISTVFDHLDNENMWAAVIVPIIAIIVMFLLAPLLIIIAVFYFVNKNRKDKMKLAQMAMEKGQPIPDKFLNEQPTEVDDEYQKGLRQCFVGIGLMIFLYVVAGTIGFGIGALVFCIGLGKVIAAKTAAKKNEKDKELNNEIDNL
ncbi:MAG: hypothetical protein IKZ62_01945 [Prevotella sp.]|nr:hypothetical protein [Prevotella sp.]